MSNVKHLRSSNGLIDELILNSVELEHLIEQIAVSLDEIEIGEGPGDSLAVQLMDILFGLEEMGRRLTELSGGRVKSLSASLASIDDKILM